MTPQQDAAETIAAQAMIIRQYRERYGSLPEPVEADEAFDHLCRCAEGSDQNPEVERLPVPSIIWIVPVVAAVLWVLAGVMIWRSLS